MLLMELLREGFPGLDRIYFEFNRIRFRRGVVQQPDPGVQRSAQLFDPVQDLFCRIRQVNTYEKLHVPLPLVNHINAELARSEKSRTSGIGKYYDNGPYARQHGELCDIRMLVFLNMAACNYRNNALQQVVQGKYA